MVAGKKSRHAALERRRSKADLISEIADRLDTTVDPALRMSDIVTYLDARYMKLLQAEQAALEDLISFDKKHADLLADEEEMGAGDAYANRADVVERSNQLNARWRELLDKAAQFDEEVAPLREEERLLYDESLEQLGLIVELLRSLDPSLPESE